MCLVCGQWLALGPSSSDVNRTPSRPVPGVAEPTSPLSSISTATFDLVTLIHYISTMPILRGPRQRHSPDDSLNTHMLQPRSHLQVQVATIPGTVQQDRTTLAILTGGRRPSSPLPQRVCAVLRDDSCPSVYTGLKLSEAKGIEGVLYLKTPMIRGSSRRAGDFPGETCLRRG